MSLGWGDGRLEGDLGLSQDGPIGPSQQANPQDSPPMASRHPARAPNPANELDRLRVKELLLEVFERADSITALARQLDLALAVVPPGRERAPNP